MMRLLVGLLLAVLATAVQAQGTSVLIVSACGTPPFTYTAGQIQPLTMDTTGKLCTGATVTPGGTQDINLKQIQGAVPSATNPIWTAPQSGTTTATTLTVQSTNVFQSVLVSSASRKGCVIQNKGSNAQYVFFGVIGSATTPLSLQLSPLQTVSCNAPSVILTDAVSITGTAGDSYVGMSQ